MAATPIHRATIIERFAGTERTFTLTFGELLALEQRLGINVVELAGRPSAIGATESQAILFHALKGGGAALKIENVATICDKVPLKEVIELAKRVLIQAFTDPEPEGDGDDAAGSRPTRDEGKS